MDCHRNSSRYKNTPQGRCNFKLRGSKVSIGKWRFDEVSGVHNHSVLDLSEEEAEVARGRRRGISEAKPRSNDSQALTLPAARPSPASSPALPTVTPNNNMDPPPLPVITASPASASASLESFPLDLISFLRAFDCPEPDLADTLSILRSSGIDSLDTLISVLAMEEENLARFVEMLSHEKIGKKVMEMAEDLRRQAM